MRISDWSSDVCSSDLAVQGLDDVAALAYAAQHLLEIINKPPPPGRDLLRQPEPAPLLQPGGAQRLAAPVIAPSCPDDPVRIGLAQPSPVVAGSALVLRLFSQLFLALDFCARPAVAGAPLRSR